VPHRAELLIGAVVAILAAATDLRDAIGFSSFAVLIYYAIANASAFTLGPDEGRPHRAVPVIGLLGCVVLAFAMPLWSVLSGVAVLGLGVAAYLIRRRIAPTRLRGGDTIPPGPDGED
jgi:APA family basic amino acid/polyamine antiporter